VDGLKRRAAEAHIESNVKFVSRFVELDELCTFLGAADVYVTPYVNEDQITSGTLSYAMGSGIASVSTPYWHAKESLANGRGRLVPFRDSPALSREVSDLLGDDTARQKMRRQAYEYSRGAVWEEVGRRYMDLFQSVVPKRSSGQAGSRQELGASVA
jgi:glycosyltransferase involved in cell wall biosynthesis